MDNNGQNLSGKIDAKKKDFSVINFQPIEVKQATAASAADAGKIKMYAHPKLFCMYVCMYIGGSKASRKAKPVEMIDCTTNKLVRIYASGSDAAEHMGLYQSGASNTLTITSSADFKTPPLTVCMLSFIVHMSISVAISLCARGLKSSYSGYKWNFYTGPDINCKAHMYVYKSLNLVENYHQRGEKTLS